LKSNQVITENYPRAKVKGLVPFGDLHWGHERCNKEAGLATLAQAAEAGDAILLMGDLGDYGLSGSVGASAYEQAITPQEQAIEIEELLTPYRSQIIGIITGNHEERIRKRTSYDISRELAKDLGVPYLGFGGIIRFVVGGRGYTIFAKHGKSGAATLGGKINAIQKYRHLCPNADVYLMGHVHDLRHIPTLARDYNTRSKTVKAKTQHFIVTGHYMDYEDSYSEEADYFPGIQGSPRILFTDDGGISVEV
jgi:UDP-2,3-diacylglucosamine pyrophosphatase LpxH